MCGIAGYVTFPDSPSDLGAVITGMTESLKHRGPDDQGIHLLSHGGMGHRRLAIIDPEGSRQPMTDSSAAGDVTLVFSGEVYNFRELRRELRHCGRSFRTKGDTEVVLQAYLHWGKEFVTRLNGMFAFAIWDAREERAYLYRDRLGIKPLYYAQIAGGLLFGSEPKAILSHPQMRAEVDAEGLRQIFGLIKIPGHAIFRGMSELLAGHLASFDRTGLRLTRYWELPAHRHVDSPERTVRHIRDLLSEIVAEQLVSDVGVGVLLSGGLDSSTIAALAKRRLDSSGESTQTFSVDFAAPDAAYVPDLMRPTQDSAYVPTVVDHLSSTHRALTVSATALTSAETRAETLHARDLPTYGEVDASLLLLCRAVRPHCTVALSGEGADELFGGYPWMQNYDATKNDCFPWLSMARSLGKYSIFEYGGVKLDLANHQRDMYHDALRRIPVFPDETPEQKLHRQLIHLHLTHFLPTPLDRKDRMSMACGLEVRVPFVDHRLVSYVFNTPEAIKQQFGREKGLLRAVASTLLPEQIYTRPKSAFPTTQDRSYDVSLASRALALIASGKEQIFEVVDHRMLRVLARMVPSGSPAVRMMLERILSVNDWMEKYSIALRA